MGDMSELFRLRIKLSHNTTLAVTVWEGAPFAIGPHHTRLDVRARLYFHDRRKRTYSELFPRGATWCGVPGHQSIDGKAARALVVSTLAMKPGDTDEDYFVNYTPEQLEFAAGYGEELAAVGEYRYGEQ